jgi:mannose-6-phosphate isomerase-like protein (cupin superfamily)
VQHRTVEEVWYFLGGSGEVWVGGETTRVTAGSTVIIPTGSPFQFRTLGDEPLRFLCFTSPPKTASASRPSDTCHEAG